MIALALATACLAASVVFAVGNGPVDIPLDQVARALAAGPDGGDDTTHRIIWSLRLPRAVGGALVGCMLALAGGMLQGVMRNPLASPNVVGLTAGAGLAATIVLTALPTAGGWLAPAAMAGAVIATLVVYAISWEPRSGTSPVRMVLAGVAITTMLGAVTTTLMITGDRAAQAVLGWMAGSLEPVGWFEVRLLGPWLAGGAIGCALLVRGLDALQLGDEGARAIGVPAERVRLAAIALAAVLAGAAVSVAGLVGFVGLMMPHIARMVVGWRHAHCLPVAALGGAALVVVSDLAAREAFAPQQLPVGVVTSLIGGPYFLFLLYRVRALR